VVGRRDSGVRSGGADATKRADLDLEPLVVAAYEATDLDRIAGGEGADMGETVAVRAGLDGARVIAELRDDVGSAVAAQAIALAGAGEDGVDVLAGSQRRDRARVGGGHEEG
jgi:hypothetical protein